MKIIFTLKSIKQVLVQHHFKTGGKSVLTLINLKEKANKAITFLKNYLPREELIVTKDLLG
ncbi:hypothetical protein [Brumimicrobium salinarum]|uniref:hypothetical protein n=1 Tax=Brumimicrobium salinarum TaxID=2058658 RepID=UPI0010546D11|nr:hypothetical protein [Brumimicrobium salinarum]